MFPPEITEKVFTIIGLIIFTLAGLYILKRLIKDKPSEDES